MIFLIVLTCQFVPTHVLNAQAHVVFDGSSTSLSLTKGLEVYIDASSSISAKQAVDLYNTKQFNKKLADVGMYSSSAIWVNIHVENKTNKELFLEIHPGIINYVSVYTVKDNNLIDSIDIGSVAPIGNKQKISRKIVYVVEPGNHKYFIRVKSNTYLPFSFDLHSEKSFYKKEHLRNIINGVLFGILVLSFLYNLLLYVSVRDLVYLNFSIFVFFSAIIMSYNFGVFNHFLYYPTMSLYITVFYCFMIASTVLFVISFLDLKSTAAEKKFKLIMWLLAIICAMDLLGFHLLANFSLFVLGGIIYSYILIVVVNEQRKGNRSARLFSVPWVLMILAYSVLIAEREFSLIPLNIGFDFIVYSGYANLVLLSFAVGNKINIYSKEKENAREKELIALRERDSVISMQKVKLEEIVQGRNRELIDKNLALSDQQNEIEAQTRSIRLKNKEINQVNEQLQYKNEQIEAQNTILKTNKQELETIVDKRTMELKVAKEKAVVADTLKTSFLNNLSREIKIPMNAITGYAGLLVDTTLSTAKRNEYLRVIIQNVHTLLSLIDDIVTLSRIQAGIMKLRFQEFDLLEFIGVIAEEFVEKLDDSKNKNIKLVVKTPNNLRGLTVVFDYNKLWLVYRHLIENAIKYTEKGNVTIGFEIEGDDLGSAKEKAPGTERNINVVCFVKDTGAGISVDDIEKYIVRRDTDINKYKFRQEGIGLAIVTGLVDLFNGSIEVKNTNGTRFYIKFGAELVNMS